MDGLGSQYLAGMDRRNSQASSTGNQAQPGVSIQRRDSAGGGTTPSLQQQQQQAGHRFSDVSNSSSFAFNRARHKASAQPPSSSNNASQQQIFGASPAFFNFLDQFGNPTQSSYPSSFTNPTQQSPVSAQSQNLQQRQQREYAQLAQNYATSMIGGSGAGGLGHGMDGLAGLGRNVSIGQATDGNGQTGGADGNDDGDVQGQFEGLPGLPGIPPGTMSLSMAVTLGLMTEEEAKSRKMSGPASAGGGLIGFGGQRGMVSHSGGTADVSGRSEDIQPVRPPISTAAPGRPDSTSKAPNGQLQNGSTDGTATVPSAASAGSMRSRGLSVDVINSNKKTTTSGGQSRPASPTKSPTMGKKGHQKLKSTDMGSLGQQGKMGGLGGERRLSGEQKIAPGPALAHARPTFTAINPSANPNSSANRHKGAHERRPSTTANSLLSSVNSAAMPAPTDNAPQTATAEFAKRKGWSQTLMNEIQDFFHVLAPPPPADLGLDRHTPESSYPLGPADGSTVKPDALGPGAMGPLFLWVSPSSFDLTGHEVDELVGKPILSFVHEDDREVVRREMARCYERDRRKALGMGKDVGLSSRSKGKRKADDDDVEMASAINAADGDAVPERERFLVYYRFKKKDGTYLVLECRGHHVFDRPSTAGLSRADTPPPPVCKAFVGVSRPYPSKNTALMDAVLSLRMENEKLLMELEDLYEDIEPGGGRVNGLAMTLRTVIADRLASGRDTPPQFASAAPSPGGSTASGSDGRSSPPSHAAGTFARTGNASSYAFPAGGSANRGGSIVDPSTGVISASGLIPSTSNTYGALGIGISPASFQSSSGGGAAGGPRKDGARVGEGVKKEDGSTKASRKKQRAEEGEFVCHDCGTVDSPEWRKGPQGPKSLCNACGLRWAKRNKQQKNAQKAAAAS